MRILFIGDVVGEPGRWLVRRFLPELRQELAPDLVIVNGENLADGFGITEPLFNELLTLGADVVTMGNHVWDHPAIFDFIDRTERLVRPANFPKGVPGRGATLVQAANGEHVVVAQVMGRLCSSFSLACPFQAVDDILARFSDVEAWVVLDIHADSTAEKLALAHYLDGRVDLVVGTHSHIPTNDAGTLPNGTVHMTDVGMTGPYDSVLGFDKAIAIQRYRTQLPRPSSRVATKDLRLHGLFVAFEGREARQVLPIVRPAEDGVAAPAP